MNIYKISQNVNTGYDTFDSAVVVAESEDEAKKIHPSGNYNNRINWWKYDGDLYDWVNDLKDVNVKLIGTASSDYNHSAVICASFNAG